jgi:subtilisin family serine protease
MKSFWGLLYLVSTLLIGLSAKASLAADWGAVVVDWQSWQCNNKGRYIVKLKTHWAHPAKTKIDYSKMAEAVFQGRDFEALNPSFSAIPKKVLLSGVGIAKNKSLRRTTKPEFVVELSEGEAKDLRADPRVRYVEKDCQISLQGDSTPAPRRVSGRAGGPAREPTDPDWELQWGFTELKTRWAWPYSRGEDVVVGICDTGVDFEHPELENVEYYVGGDSSSFDATFTENRMSDNHGHGTHIAGTIGAEVDNGHGIAGIAPGAKIVSGKIFTAEATGYISWLARCLERMIELDVDVVNLSVSGPYGITGHIKAREAMDKGITLVLAAGNNGTYYRYSNHINSFPGLIKVAALASAELGGNERLADFSNYGDWIDIVAPGQLIYAPILRGGYGSWSGTSMAAPHVAAVVALMKGAYSGISDPEILDFMKSTARGFEYRNLPYLALDAYGATKASYYRRRMIDLYGGIPQSDDNWELAGGIKAIVDGSEIEIHGWAYDQDRESEPVDVFLQVRPDGASKFVSVEKFRADICDEEIISEAFAPSCFHKFIAKLPLAARSGSYDYRIVAEDYSAQRNREEKVLALFSDPLQSEFEVTVGEFSSGTLPLGEIESFDIVDGTLSVRGWVWDPDRENYHDADSRFNRIQIYHHRVGSGAGFSPYAYEMRADAPRPDLIDDGKIDPNTSPNHGFEFSRLLQGLQGEYEFMIVTFDYIFDGETIGEPVPIRNSEGQYIFTHVFEE